MSTYRLRKFLPITFGIAVLVMVISLYVGYILQPQNEDLSRAGSFAGATGATVGILVAAFAIYIEQRRSEERHDEANAAWAAASRLRTALIALEQSLKIHAEGDWYRADSGSPRQAPDDRGSLGRPGEPGDVYMSVLHNVREALRLCIETSVGRVLGVTWLDRGDESESGWLTTFELITLHADLDYLIDGRSAGQMAMPDERTMASLHALYLALNSRSGSSEKSGLLRLENFRHIYETSDVDSFMPRLGLVDRYLAQVNLSENPWSITIRELPTGDEDIYKGRVLGSSRITMEDIADLQGDSFESWVIPPEKRERPFGAPS